MTDPNTGELICVVSEFVRRLQETSTGGRRLFRGQNTDKPLLPRIVRLAQEKGISFAQMKGISRRCWSDLDGKAFRCLELPEN
jgi:hypothetical protein